MKTIIILSITLSFILNACGSDKDKTKPVITPTPTPILLCINRNSGEQVQQTHQSKDEVSCVWLQK